MSVKKKGNVVSIANERDIEEATYLALLLKGDILPTTRSEVAFVEEHANLSDEELPDNLVDPKDVLIKAKDRNKNGVKLSFRHHISNSSDMKAQHNFSKLINLLRREKSLSVGDLSEKAGIDEEEIVHIERDEGYQPEPRTVYQLANYFDLEKKSLQELSGNVRVKAEGVCEEAIKYAAKSASVEKLSIEEHAALEKFIAYLSKR